MAYARNILIVADGLDYKESYIIPEETEKTIIINDDWIEPAQAKESWFTLYPNPANNYLAVEYKLNILFSNPIFIIRNIKGQSITGFEAQGNKGIKIIDLQNWDAGTYIVSLKSNGGIIQSEKFTKY